MVDSRLMNVLRPFALVARVSLETALAIPAVVAGATMTKLFGKRWVYTVAKVDEASDRLYPMARGGFAKVCSSCNMLFEALRVGRRCPRCCEREG